MCTCLILIIIFAVEAIYFIHLAQLLLAIPLSNHTPHDCFDPHHQFLRTQLLPLLVLLLILLLLMSLRIESRWQNLRVRKIGLLMVKSSLEK
jgi:hypothetical protein